MVRKKVIFPGQIRFDWDKGNFNKNRLRHGVECNECEELFFNKPLIVSEDGIHSNLTENRFKALGITNNKRCLFTVFTIRGEKIRIISARDQNRKERIFYKGGVKK